MTELFKFFGWKTPEGYWRGQKLIPLSAISHLRLLLRDHPAFCSLQTYDEQAQVLFSPVYCDLDGRDPKQAQQDARYIVYLLGDMTNIIPDIYYSGNKGYHIIIPYRIEHPMCHLVAKHFFEYLAKDLPTLDKSVYRMQAMFRLPNSVASRPGYHKVQITKDELMRLDHDQITELARTPRLGVISEFDSAQINDEFLSAIAKGITKIPRYEGQPLQLYMRDLGEEMTPCIARMIEEGTVEGQRNRTVMLIGRLFKKCGMTESAARELLLSKQYWHDYEKEERGVSGCFKSLWASRRPAVIGCKVGADADLMKSFCDPLCWFNEERMEISFSSRRKA